MHEGRGCSSTARPEPTSSGWQYSESLGHGGGVVGPALKQIEIADDPGRWVENAWRSALGRTPSAQERTEALHLFESLARLENDAKLPDNFPEQLAALPSRKGLALAQICLALFNLNEFSYVD